MKTFKDLVFLPHEMMPGLQARYFFENGYGVSVVRFTSLFGGYGSYTNSETEWELAVLCGTKDDYEITYDTPITDDVMGNLEEAEVTEIMLQVQNLPATAKQLKPVI